VDHIVNLTEEAIDLTRKLARGLHPMEFTEEGFMDALGELAEIIQERFKIPCRFECEDLVGTLGQQETTQLLRIAQEAATNAARHSKAGEIVICLECSEDFTTLSVSDDGVGISENVPDRQGMGLRIMAYRADLIGAKFEIGRVSPHGTRVACAIPRPS
jgi:signal transduction histidine kinase